MTSLGDAEKLYEAAVKNEKFNKSLRERRRVDRSFDIPNVWGFSKDDATVYIDRDCPDEWKDSGDSHKIDLFLLTRASAVAAYSRVIRGSYQDADAVGAWLERRSIQNGGLLWGDWRKFVDSLSKHSGSPDIQRLPLDLDLRPYSGELLAELKLKIQSKYGDDRGKSTRHCGPDKKWPTSYCGKFISAHACREVKGFIDPGAACDWFKLKRENDNA